MRVHYVLASSYLCILCFGINYYYRVATCVLGTQHFEQAIIMEIQVDKGVMMNQQSIMHSGSVVPLCITVNRLLSTRPFRNTMQEYVHRARGYLLRVYSLHTGSLENSGRGLVNRPFIVW